MKIVVAGNCQAQPFKRVLLNVLDNVEISAYTIHSANNEVGRKFSQEVREADLVLSFRISDNFRIEDFRPAQIEKNAGSRFKTITNLFFSGYHPDYSYVNGQNGKRLQGVLGDYHSKICLVGCLLGCGPSEIVHAMVDRQVGKDLGYHQVFNRSLGDLEERDKAIDIGYAKRLAEIANKEELFLTFNHPKNYVFFDYVFHILNEIGLPYKKQLQYGLPEMLGSGPALAIHPLVSDVVGGCIDSFRENSVKAANSTGFIELSEFTEKSIQHYKEINESTKNHILSTPWAERITKVLNR